MYKDQLLLKKMDSHWSLHMSNQKGWFRLALLLLLISLQSHTSFCYQDQIYGTPCAGSFNTRDCTRGVQCNVNLTIHIDSGITTTYCNDRPDAEENLLRNVIQRENFCEVISLSSNGRNVQGNPCTHGYVCEEHAFYITVNGVWYLPLRCISSGNQLCATRTLERSYRRGECASAVRTVKHCSYGEACVHQYQHVYTPTGTNEITYKCYPVCKVTEPTPDGRHVSTYHTRCPKGMVCSKNIKDIHYWPNCNPVQGYHCQPWRTYIESLLKERYFFSFFGTYEGPCKIMDVKTAQFEDIYKCPAAYPCIRFQVPQSATVPEKVDYHEVDDQSIFYAYYCDTQVIPQIKAKVKADLPGTHGIQNPILCRAQFHNPPGLEPFDIDSCYYGYTCTQISHHYIQLNHTVFNRVVQTSHQWFTSWVCLSSIF